MYWSYHLVAIWLQGPRVQNQTLLPWTTTVVRPSIDQISSHPSPDPGAWGKKPPSFAVNVGDHLAAEYWPGSFARTSDTVDEIKFSVG